MAEKDVDVSDVDGVRGMIEQRITAARNADDPLFQNVRNTLGRKDKPDMMRVTCEIIVAELMTDKRIGNIEGKPPGTRDDAE